MLKITRKNTFEAAHHLPQTPPGHKCRNVHGHSYELTVVIAGKLDNSGWIIDTAQIDDVFKMIHEQLDHKLLNDVIPNPTTENLAIWCWDRFMKAFEGVGNIEKIAVEIRESPRSTALYDGP